MPVCGSSRNVPDSAIVPKNGSLACPVDRKNSMGIGTKAARC